MSGEAGWYPDPGGQPDRYRYWDGASWSAQTAADPFRAAPSSATGASGEPRPRAARWLVVSTVAAVLVAVVALAAEFRTQDLGSGPVPGPTAGTAANPIDNNTPPPNGTPTPQPERNIGCPEGAPDARSPHPADDRVYGGSLSFARVPTFTPEAPENRLTFAYDVTQQVRTVALNPSWIAELAVGRLLADGYPRDAQHTAEFVTECIVASDLYRPYLPQRHDVTSHPIQISGQNGWLLVTDVDVTDRGLAFPGDRVAVVVVPDGADWGMFFGAVPIGDRDLTATLNRTISSLRAA